MKKGLLFPLFLLFILLIVPFLSSTQVNIKSFPSHKVEVRALVSGSVYSLIESFYGSTDASGMFSQVISLDESEFDVKVWIKNGNDVVVSERFDGISLSDTLNLVMFPGSVETVDSFEVPAEATNETEPTNITENTTEVANDSVEDSSIDTAETPPEAAGITGLSTSEDTGFFSGSSLYYIIGVVVLLAIGFFGFTAFKKSQGAPTRGIKVKKLSELQREREEMSGKSVEEYKHALDSAQKKLEESQREISKLKNQEKIKQIEDRMNKEKEEVNRLRRGY